MPGMAGHIIRQGDIEKRTGICDVCGPVHIYVHNAVRRIKLDGTPGKPVLTCEFAARDRFLRKTYGITDQEYQELSRRQNHCCAICGAPRPGRRHLDVDHCHDTDVIRGLLCSGCNGGIGQLRDDISLLRKAIAYLQQPPAIVPANWPGAN